MSFISFLDKIGGEIKLGFDAIKGLAPLAGLLPIVGPEITVVFGVISAIEQKYAALGTQSGTGVAKLEEVTAIVGGLVAQLLAGAGQPNAAADVEKYINAAVSWLNAAPAVPSA